jgi:hypothetical protein
MHHIPSEGVVADRDFGSFESTGCVFNHGECLRKQGVGRSSFGDTSLELGCFGPELVVAQALIVLFKHVDPANQRGALTKEAAVMAAGKEFEESEEHRAGRLNNERDGGGMGKAEGEPFLFSRLALGAYLATNAVWPKTSLSLVRAVQA